jgi:ketosteroid isomerase-like protein
VRLWLIAAVFTLASAAGAAPKDDMMAADKAFSAMSVVQGEHKAFLAYMTDDARLYIGDRPPIMGKAAAAAHFEASEKSDPNYKNLKTEWTPAEAEASPDGVLGWTRGTWIRTWAKADGTATTLTGYYVTEWRRQPDGNYKFCLDIGGADKH